MKQNLTAERYTGWQLIKAYWQSEQRLSAYVLLISVLFMSVILVGFDVIFTTWYNYFYNALQDYDAHAAYALLWIFLFLAAVNIVIAVYRYYLQNYLALRWRRWLTTRCIDRWLEKKGYYYLEDFGQQTDNPDQRIQEDVGLLITYTLGLFVGLLSAIVTIFSFVYVLWILSKSLIIPLGSWGTFHVSGYLVWVALAYAGVGTFLTYKIGRPLVNLNFEQQRREANFRFAAIDLRSHAEHIALYRGEHQQKNILRTIFGGVLENWYAIILRQKLLLWFTSGYNQIALILPVVLIIPSYFGKAFKLGGLMQANAAFRNIQDALSFIVNSYTTIAEWQATMRRLLTFLNHLQTIETQAEQKNQFLYLSNSENKIKVNKIKLFTPKNKLLLENISQEFIHGKHYWIKGESGMGKSTFVRAIAGIWPYGSGEISLPQTNTIFYVPQRSYMPIGTLKESLLFPNELKNTSDESLAEILRDCDLAHLTTELHTATNWSERLSPGELQRIAFARVLLHKPAWVFLDESTSSLDLQREQRLYELLKRTLPNCSIISVGHRPSLQAYHDHEINFGLYVAD